VRFNKIYQTTNNHKNTLFNALRAWGRGFESRPYRTDNEAVIRKFITAFLIGLIFGLNKCSFKLLFF
jgi:hypothetical protein